MFAPGLPGQPHSYVNTHTVRPLSDVLTLLCTVQDMTSCSQITMRIMDTFILHNHGREWQNIVHSGCCHYGSF